MINFSILLSIKRVDEKTRDGEGNSLQGYYWFMPCYRDWVIGWSDFWQKYWIHVIMYYVNCYGTQFLNFTLKCCFFNYCRASENFSCNPKISTQKYFISDFWRLHLTQNGFLWMFKSKKWIETENFLFFVWPGQEQCWPFRGP